MKYFTVKNKKVGNTQPQFRAEKIFRKTDIRGRVSCSDVGKPNQTCSNTNKKEADIPSFKMKSVVRKAILKFNSNFNSTSDNIECSRDVGDQKIATIVRTKTQPHPPSKTKPNISENQTPVNPCLTMAPNYEVGREAPESKPNTDIRNQSEPNPKPQPQKVPNQPHATQPNPSEWKSTKNALHLLQNPKKPAQQTKTKPNPKKEN